MKVISCFNEIVDGVITSITYNVEENGSIIQETTVEIIDVGNKAVLKSNKLYTSDEMVIKKSFIAIVKILKENGITELYATKNNGELIEVVLF